MHSLLYPGSGVDIEQLVLDLHERLDSLQFRQVWQVGAPDGVDGKDSHTCHFASHAIPVAADPKPDAEVLLAAGYGCGQGIVANNLMVGLFREFLRKIFGETT